MESERESQSGICYECSTKDADSSQKPVYRCDLCEKWFCERHLEPKFPYFVDWDTVFNVEGDPRIKALFYTEYRREGGHPDFIFLRKTIESLELEEKIRNQLIKQAIDRMEEANRKRRIERWEKERATGKTTTTENKYGYRFVVPLEVYSNAEYREYLNYAKTMKSVKVIVDEYYKKHPEAKHIAKEEVTKEQQEPEKKKHWWQ
jgi:hypothetical protein